MNKLQYKMVSFALWKEIYKILWFHENILVIIFLQFDIVFVALFQGDFGVKNKNKQILQHFAQLNS